MTQNVLMALTGSPVGMSVGMGLMAAGQDAYNSAQMGLDPGTAFGKGLITGLAGAVAGGLMGGATGAANARQANIDALNNMGVYNRFQAVETYDGKTGVVRGGVNGVYEIDFADGTSTKLTAAGIKSVISDAQEQALIKAMGIDNYTKNYKGVQRWAANRKATQEVLNEIGEKFNKNIVVSDQIDGRNAFLGAYDPSTNTLTFHSRASVNDILLGVAMHEITHTAETSAQYGAYASEVLDYAYDGDAAKIEAAIDKKLASYARQNAIDTTLSAAEQREKARREVVAEAVRTEVFANPQDVIRFAQSKPEAAKGLLGFVKQAIAKMRDTVIAHTMRYEPTDVFNATRRANAQVANNREIQRLVQLQNTLEEIVTQEAAGKVGVQRAQFDPGAELMRAYGADGGVSAQQNVGNAAQIGVNTGQNVANSAQNVGNAANNFRVGEQAAQISYLTDDEGGGVDENAVVRNAVEGKPTINPNFIKDYDRWLDRGGSKEFILGITPKLLQDLGMTIKTVTMDSGKIRKMKREHPGMTDDIVRRIPEFLENPIIVMQSNQDEHKSRLTMFNDSYFLDKEGRMCPLFVVVELLPTRRGTDIEIDKIKFVTAWHRIEGSQTVINYSDVYYIEPDTKRLQSWMSHTGLKMPVALNGKTGIIKMIPEEFRGINKQSENNSEIDKNLYASTNISTDNFIKADKLGGLPMPSIAISNNKVGNTFDPRGEKNSIIFPFEVINPEIDARNKVYPHDVWTAIVPQLSYKANEKSVLQLRTFYDEMTRKYGSENTDGLYALANDTEQYLDGKGGMASIKADLYNDVGLMRVYLAENGNKNAVRTKNDISAKHSPEELGRAKIITDFVGENFFQTTYDEYKNKKLWNYPENNKSRYVSDVIQALLDENPQGIIDNTDAAAKYLDEAYNIYKDFANTSASEYAVSDAEIKKLAKNTKYSEWIDTLTKNIVEKTGVYNGKEYLNENGQRRTWEQLHSSPTLENIVQIMAAQENNKNYTKTSLRSGSGSPYGTMDEIKAQRGRIGTREEAETARKVLEDKYDGLLQEISDRNNADVFKVGQIVAEAYENYKTDQKRLDYCKKYIKGITADDIKQINGIYGAYRNAKTDYLEAKPQKAVHLENGAAVLSKNSPELIEIAQRRNMPYKVHDPAIEGDFNKKSWELATDLGWNFALEDDPNANNVSDSEAIQNAVEGQTNETQTAQPQPVDIDRELRIRQAYMDIRAEAEETIRWIGQPSTPEEAQTLELNRRGVADCINAIAQIDARIAAARKAQGQAQAQTVPGNAQAQAAPTYEPQTLGEAAAQQPAGTSQSNVRAKQRMAIRAIPNSGVEAVREEGATASTVEIREAWEHKRATERHIKTLEERGGDADNQMLNDLRNDVEMYDEYIGAHRRAIREGREEVILEMTEGSGKWRDKNWGFLYSRETMERNMVDISNGDYGAQRIVDEIFEPVNKNEADGQRFLNEMRQRVRDMDLTRAESILVQAYGEGRIDDMNI